MQRASRSGVALGVNTAPKARNTCRTSSSRASRLAVINSLMLVRPSSAKSSGMARLCGASARRRISSAGPIWSTLSVLPATSRAKAW